MDQTSPSQKEGAVVKQDAEEEPTEECQETWEGNDTSVSTVQLTLQ